MSAQFWPCPVCSRHVKGGDATCPFCGATASIEISPKPTVAARLSRAALFAAGAVGAAVATASCGSMYGGPPGTHVENGSGDSTGSETPDAADAANLIAIPPIDSAFPSSDADASTDTGPTDSSSVADVPMLSEAAYGSPPIGQPAYGAAIFPDE
jgi:hypothetical protein